MPTSLNKKRIEEETIKIRIYKNASMYTCSYAHATNSIKLISLILYKKYKFFRKKSENKGYVKDTTREKLIFLNFLTFYQI